MIKYICFNIREYIMITSFLTLAKHVITQMSKLAKQAVC